MPERTELQTRFRPYCVTLNNWTEAEYQAILTDFRKRASYFVIGKEVGESGTPHLQIYVYFKNEREFTSLKKLMPRAHIKCKYPNSTHKQASDYCKKEDMDFVEEGTHPVDRNVNLWKEISDDIIAGMSWVDLTLKYPEYAVKYLNGLKCYFETHRPKYLYTLPEPIRPFQQQILDLEKEPINDREIFWIYDQQGGCGKSKLADHLIANHGYYAFSNGKNADIACAWNGENVVFDYSRCQESHINYGIIEDIKNGRVFSPKYQSALKIFKPPRVYVFSNFMPDTTKMSEDRWSIYSISPDYKLIKLN